ncbi:hypothetical protein HYU96_04460 [Candidatus Daviesbacteria bacterium]|nr:hypothetical protein [Candidatus Daviesbacteria bacterium]
MTTKILIAAILATIFLTATIPVMAAGKENAFCLPPPDVHFPCETGFTCRKNPDFNPPINSDQFTCQKDVFGTIKPPDALKNFIGQDETGATGISRFLSNLVALFYILAAIVLIFMILWGAWDWITSEGEKEKLEAARKKIINAIVGIILFAVAFAIIQVLGQFTGFKFFEGQK